MRLLLFLLTLLMFVLSGCATGPFDAPPSATFSDVEDIIVPWFGCTIDDVTGLPDPECRESDPVIFPLSIYVEDEDTNLPINDVRVTFTSLWGDIYVMPQSVIEAVVLPNSERWSDVDAGGEVFAQFSGQYEENYQPTFHDTWTDAAGRARTWVFIERMPQDEAGQVVESTILIDMGVETVAFKMQSAG